MKEIGRVARVPGAPLDPPMQTYYPEQPADIFNIHLNWFEGCEVKLVKLPTDRNQVVHIHITVVSLV